MANEIIRELEIDVARENIFAAILAKQYDKATRYILATITNLGVAMTVDSNSIITINFERPHTDDEDPSDYQAAFSGSVVNGKVKVPLPYWALERDGDVRADISMTIGNNRLSTLTFIIRVQPAAYDGNAVTEDTNYDVLTGLILQVQTLNSTVTSAESARNSAETARAAAESTRAAAESARTSAETTRASHETARVNAETTRAAAETGRVNAENSRVAAETQRQQNYNNLTADMETAIENINAAAENAEIVQEIAATMQITFFYDDEGYPCYQDKSTN